jgi:hypothetical protein
MNTDSSVRVFDLYGFPVEITAPARAWDLLGPRLSEFPQARGGTPDLQLFLRAGSSAHSIELPSTNTRVVVETDLGRVLYAADEDTLFVDYCGHIQGVCQFATGQASMSLEPGDENVWMATHQVLTIFLVEWLKRKGRYSLHAAGACLAGKGLLFPGTTGAGKSTLSFALAGAGFQYLGDDMVFLTTNGEDCCANAFPEPIDLTPDCLQLFPELEAAVQGRPNGWRKFSVSPHEFLGAETRWTCLPTLLVFPGVSGRATSTLAPMDAGEALVELAANVLLTEPHSTQLHLDALALLVRQCKCFQLETGRDFQALARMLGELVAPEGAP